MRLLVLVALLLFPTLALAQPPISGEWKGTLDAGSQKLPMVLTFGDKVTVRTPTQGNITAEGQMTREGDNLTLTFPSNGSQLKLKVEPTALGGLFSQRGLQIPIVFTRDGAETAALVRPQTPKAPYPYRSEEVNYQGDGVSIAGTLTLPQGAGPFPAVLMITGSGAQDRDETLVGHKPFAVIADTLTRRGIAVLRVDDRGVGGSTGSLTDATIEVLAKDVAAGVAFLRGRRDIDARRVGLFGHSEGATVAPLAAAADPTIGFVVLMAGTGVNGAEIVIRQHRLALEAAGVPKAVVDQANATQAVMSRLIASDASSDTLKAEIEKALAGQPASQVAVQVGAATAPSYRAFLRHEPAPVLAKLKMPVLAVWGSKDLQVDPEQNAPPMRAALAGNPRARLEVLPGLNHLLQTATTGSVSEYALIEETIAPSALKLIGDWVVAQAGAQ